MTKEYLRPTLTLFLFLHPKTSFDKFINVFIATHPFNPKYLHSNLNNPKQIKQFPALQFADPTNDLPGIKCSHRLLYNSRRGPRRSAKKMKIAVCVAVTIFVVLINYSNAEECQEGQSKTEVCNSCRCIKGQWACTKMKCIQKREAVQCHDGEAKRVDCNTCTCANGVFACTRNLCVSKKEKLSLRNSTISCQDPSGKSQSQRCAVKSSRSRRKLRYSEDAPFFADLKVTPSAPNDFFKVDCNTCYCNIDRTGYLCTDNRCSEANYRLQTTTQIPLTNDSMLVVSNTEVKLVENLNSTTTPSVVSQIARTRRPRRRRLARRNFRRWSPIT
ncbi:hypothetical protein NQ317_003945 [Molorchus minor]|uniref:Pacifastin domain-containing protein n=1 Tax=Molorchus minor TaxID=1323400 RepID=A0ABQ9JEJ0_9CUCU|nr:hypothetical protein NQ317_003945 [Molorchus minor]